MISRRAALGAALAVGGTGTAALVARRAGVLDDALQSVGVRPHTEPDPRDVALLAEAAQGQRELLAAVGGLAEHRDHAELAGIEHLLNEQLAAVTDPKAPPSAPPSPLPTAPDNALTAFAAQVDRVAQDRAEGALAAGSLAVTKVLASMAAGLDQIAVAVRELS